jgi:hypothetical protein
MKKLFLLLFLALNCWAITTSLKSKIHQTLPTPLQFIELGKTQLNDVEKKLGKAALVEKNKHYYDLDGFKYSLEITYHNKKVEQVYFTFTKNRPTIENFNFDKKDLSSYPVSGGAAGRFLKYQDSDGEIIIDPIEKNIYAVRIK